MLLLLEKLIYQILESSAPHEMELDSPTVIVEVFVEPQRGSVVLQILQDISHLGRKLLGPLNVFLRDAIGLQEPRI